MSEVETFEHNGKTISIWYEPEPDIGNPRDADNLGVMLANGHRRYTLGDQPFKRDIEEYDEADRASKHFNEIGKLHLFDRWCRIYLGSTVVLKLGLIDHSGISMYVGGGAHEQDPGGWDSGTIGFIFDTTRTREMCGTPLDKIEEALRDEVKYYDMYLTGQVYGYTVNDGEDDEDSCGGFLGLEYTRQSARDAAGYSCSNCGEQIHRGFKPVDGGGYQDWCHQVCSVCGGRVAYGQEGPYHLHLDITASEHHRADPIWRRACDPNSGDAVATPKEKVEAYE